MHTCEELYVQCHVIVRTIDESPCTYIIVRGQGMFHNLWLPKTYCTRLLQSSVLLPFPHGGMCNSQLVLTDGFPDDKGQILLFHKVKVLT